MMLVQLGIAAPLKMQKRIDFESLKSQAHVYLLHQSKTPFTLFRTIFFTCASRLHGTLQVPLQKHCLHESIHIFAMLF